MAALQCEICGGKLKAMAGGLFECEYCGMQYDKLRIQEMVQEIKGTVSVEGTVQVAGNVTVDSTADTQKKVQRMYIALKDREYQTAEQVAEQILTADPENADAYLGKLMAKRKISTKEDIANSRFDIDNLPEYKNAMKYGSEEIKRLLTDANNTIVTKKKNSIASNRLSWAKRYFEEEEYDKAISSYKDVADTYDAAKEIELCEKMIYARDNFHKFCLMACAGSPEKLQKAYDFFCEYNKYPACKKAVSVCNRLQKLTSDAPKKDVAKSRQLNKEVRELNEKKLQQEAALKQLGLFGKRDKKKELREEIAAIESELQPRLTQLNEIDNVENVHLEKCRELHDELMSIDNILQMRKAKQGQKVTFGRYYKDSKKLEPLTWIVFKEEGNKLYLLTENIIDAVPFGTAVSSKLYWKDSNLYKWLNGTFCKTAFRDFEKKYIVEVTEPKERDLEYRKDYSAKVTDYAYSKRVTTTGGKGSWFLQCDVYGGYCPDKVTERGSALKGYSMQGVIIHNLTEGVRPMVILDISKFK